MGVGRMWNMALAGHKSKRPGNRPEPFELYRSTFSLLLPETKLAAQCAEADGTKSKQS
jgi:hypothetical protein